MVAMDLEGKIRRPRTEFDDEGVRYEHRFAPLGHVSTPPLVPYMQFKEMTRVITWIRSPWLYFSFVDNDDPWRTCQRQLETITVFALFPLFVQLEFSSTEDTKASHASSLYATACRHFHQAATILTALSGHSADENVRASPFPWPPGTKKYTGEQYSWLLLFGSGLITSFLLSRSSS